MNWFVEKWKESPGNLKSIFITIGICAVGILIGAMNQSSNVSAPVTQTFGERYPNITAFVNDFNAMTDGEKGVPNRLRRLMATDPNFDSQHISEQGFRNTYFGPNGELGPAINCAAQFAKDHTLNYSSCDAGEKILISHNYLDSSAK